MHLYLVRHGEAKAEQEDPARPLSSRGRDEVDRVSRAAAKKGMAASRILHSDKLRAKQTAEILARNIIPSEGICEIKGLGPEDDPSGPRPLISQIPSLGICEIKGLGPEDDPSLIKAELEASGKSLIVVGHLPHLNRLAAMLLNGNSSEQVIDFPTASVVCLSCRKKDWKVNWTMDPAGA